MCRRVTIMSLGWFLHELRLEQRVFLLLLSIVCGFIALGKQYVQRSSVPTSRYNLQRPISEADKCSAKIWTTSGRLSR
jgi:hypothetical protein